MSLSGILLGLIDIAIVVAILLLIGALILWLLSWLSFPVPETVQKLYIAIVALVALAMLVSLAFGIPTFRIIRAAAVVIPLAPQRRLC